MTTILIIDDDPRFRAQAAAVLESDGFVVIGVAIDGRSGIDRARAIRPDCVLVDIGLPDIDGFSVAEDLAADLVPPWIVLMSSRDAGAYGPRLAGGPWVGFLPKDELSGAAIRALKDQA